MAQRLFGAESESTAKASIAQYGHAEGQAAYAGGVASHAEGQSTSATGVASHAEGYATSASGTYSHAEGGSSIASGTYSHAGGGGGATASAYGQWARRSAVPSGSSRSQTSFYHMGVSTSGTTAFKLTFDGSGAAILTGATTNVLVIPPRSVFTFELYLVVRQNVANSSTGSVAIFTGAIGRDTTGSAVLLGTPTRQSFAGDVGSYSAFALSINTTDATNNYLDIVATPLYAGAMVISGTMWTTELQTTN